MMNKVARYRGIANRAMTNEPGYIYVDEDGNLCIFDELRKVHKFVASEAMDEIKEDADKSDIELRLSVLEDKVKALSKTNIEPVETQPGAPIEANDPTKDYVIAGESDAVASLDGKSVEMNNFKYELPEGTSVAGNSSNALLVKAGDVEIGGSELAMHQQTSSNCLKVTEAKTLTIKDTTFSGETYNTIMTGQNTDEFLKYFIVENCEFAEDCKHVNIWIGGFQDGAVVDIKNCHFYKAEQTFCISDFHNAPGNSLTFNLENVVIDNYEVGDEYEGFILFDSRTVYGDNDFASFKEANPFKNVTINIKNVTVGGVKLTADNFKMGTGEAGQMLYLYIGAKNFNGDRIVPFNAENEDLFPKVVFK